MTDDAQSDQAKVDPDLDRLRRENEELRTRLDGEQAGSGPTGHRRRARIALVLVIVGGLLLPLAVVAVWARNQVLDTDRYVANVAPLADDPGVREAVADRVTARVAEAVDIESRAREALPDDASFLAAPIASGAENLIHELTMRLLETEEFAALWEEANRVAHDALVAALTSSGGEVVGLEDGKVVLHLGEVAERVVERVDDALGLDLADRIPSDALATEVVLVEVERLGEARKLVEQLDRLAWFTYVLALAALVGSVIVAPDRRRGLRNVGFSAVASMAALAVLVGLLRQAYSGGLPDAVQNPEVALTVFDVLTRFIREAARAVFAVGLVLVVGTWMAGPSTSADRFRAAMLSLTGRTAGVVGGRVDAGPAPRWVATHLGALRAGVLALAALVVIWWDRPSGAVVLAVAGLAAVAVIGLQIVAAMAPTTPAPGDDGRVDDVDTSTTTRRSSRRNPW